MISFLQLVPLFWAGYFFNEPLFWLHWAGFARLCFLYQARRRGNFWKDFLAPCWGVFLAVYSVCFFWMLLHDVCVYVLGVLIYSFFFPLLFLLHYLSTSKVRSQLVDVAAAFGIFFTFEFLLSRIPAMESVGLDIFFQPPVAVLCVLKFINFKVWSSWVFATCFAISCWALEKKGRPLVLLLVGGMAALVFFAHAQDEFSWGREKKGRTVKVALVQPNLPYSDEWRDSYFVEIKKKYCELASKAALGAPDMIVFPLYSLPGDVYREPAFLEDLARTARCPVLIAAHVPIKAGDEAFDLGFMNLALLYNSDGTVRDIYQAVDALPFLYQYVKKAEKYRVIRGPFGKLGVLLCYEDMIPRHSRAAARDGVGVLVALSNPGLFQKTPLPYYQLFQDQIRAAETGLPLVRVSENGYSALIDQKGRIVQKTKLGTEEILQVELSGFGPGESGGEAPRNPLLDEVGRLKRS